MGEREGVLIRPHVRHRLVNTGATEASLVFHLGPLAPRPELGHIDTETTPEQAVRRVVVTGIGVVAPGGPTREAFWELITAGRTATRRITFFDPPGSSRRSPPSATSIRSAAGLDADEVGRMDRYVQFAVAAAAEAIADSGLERAAHDIERTGVTLGSAVGGTTMLEDGYVAVSDGGREWLVDPALVPAAAYQALVPSTLASEVALRFGAHGPAVVVSTGCTSGIDAVGYGHQLIQDGEADIVLAGASESGISPISMACFDPIGATSCHNDEPRAGVAAVRRQPRRLRHGRGLRRARARGARARPRARGPDRTARSPATPAAATPST